MIRDLDDFFAFTYRWFDATPGELGISEKELPVGLPEPLRRFYCAIGTLTLESCPFADNQWELPLGTQDGITPPAQLKFGDDWIEFASENQGNWSARCLRIGEDPPVLMNWAWMSDEAIGDAHVRVGSNLSDYLISFSLQEFVFHSRSRGAKHGTIAGFEPLPLWVNKRLFNYEGWGTKPMNNPSHSFFISPNEAWLLMKGWTAAAPYFIADRNVSRRRVDRRAKE